MEISNIGERVAIADHATNTKTLVLPDHSLVEAWGQGFMVGALVILIMITLSNMRSGVLLHKLILMELLLAVWHGTFIFLSEPIYGWYLSTSAVLLYLSYNLHNVISWIKNKPFLPRWGSMFYIGTIILVFPYWISEMYLNFQYDNNLGNAHFEQTRPWEALARDPWWIFTAGSLIYIIKREYGLGVVELVRTSPRFGILLTTISFSLIFIVADVVDTARNRSNTPSQNPYWKLALVFKCGSDALFLDDFKKVLDQLTQHSLGRFNNSRAGIAGSLSDAKDSDAAEVRQIHDFGLEPIQKSGTAESSDRIRPQETETSHSGHFLARRRHRRPKPTPLPLSHESGQAGQKSDLQKPEVAHISPGQKRSVEWFDIVDKWEENDT